ncbi:uncharacterized protein LTR77_005931 [Saxophila tyrrhenica]|uniref:Heterokaryon incompatibility domain-containing protein n=1 Tax=Saxophila tyrrhenica TaxID=1690608 RepID=A0AAV9P9G6_9PEZI|nr:hypothetical protein LTR77_005931 [Saxophila tyrrhenica]
MSSPHPTHLPSLATRPHFCPQIHFFVFKKTVQRMALPITSYSRRLAHDEIRVLLLEPSSDRTADIRCDLVVRAVDASSPAYEALSYTWGPPYLAEEDDGAALTGYTEEVRHISLCGIRQPVGSNLSDCLKRLRFPRSTRVLWVDALCINQQDDEERSHQVSIMSKVYRNRSRVAIWLGEDSPIHEAEVMMPFFRSIFEPSSELEKFETNLPYRKGAEDCQWIDQRFQRLLTDIPGVPTVREITSYANSTNWTDINGAPVCFHKDDRGFERSPIATYFWQCFFHMCTQTCFRRRWVLQELCLASRAEVLCGDFHMEWHQFTAAHYLTHDLLRDMGSGLPLWEFIDPPALRPYRPSDVEKRREGFPREFRTYETPDMGPGMALLSQMRTFHDAMCQDPRDCIYSLMAFDDRQTVQPDYSLTPQQLWTQFYRVLISEGHLSCLLTEASRQISSQQSALSNDNRRRLRFPALPSWLLDFAAVDTMDSFEHLHLACGKAQVSTARIHEPDRLDCTLQCIGQVVLRTAWALLGPEISAATLNAVSKAGPSPIGGQYSFSFTAPQAIEVIGGHNFALHSGDYICLWLAGGYTSCIALRRVHGKENMTTDALQEDVYRIIGQAA